MTAQVHEKLILNGKKTSMNFCPPIPSDPNIVKLLSKEEYQKAYDAGKIEQITHSTACWRGYIGTWEIKDGKFYLKDLNGAVKLAKKGPIFASWFTGVLRVPQGEMLQYVHMGFATRYEKELRIKIEEGIVTDESVIDNTNRDPNDFSEDDF